MKICWSLRSIPELADLPEEKHKEILKECSFTELEKTPVFWWRILVLPFLLTGMALGKICGGKISSILGLAVGGIIGVFVSSQIQIYIIRSRVRRNLPIYRYKYGKANKKSL
jgi:hypothetical protein